MSRIGGRRRSRSSRGRRRAARGVERRRRPPWPAAGRRIRPGPRRTAARRLPGRGDVVLAGNVARRSARRRRRARRGRRRGRPAQPAMRDRAQHQRGMQQCPAARGCRRCRRAWPVTCFSALSCASACARVDRGASVARRLHSAPRGTSAARSRPRELQYSAAAGWRRPAGDRRRCRASRRRLEVLAPALAPPRRRRPVPAGSVSAASACRARAWASPPCRRRRAAPPRCGRP